MRVIGYVRGTDQHDQARRVEGGAAFRDDELLEILTEDPERLRERLVAGDVAAVLVSRLDRLPAGWLDDDGLLELLERHGVALVAGRERIDTSTADGRVKLAELRTDRVRAAVDGWAETRRRLDSPAAG